MRKILLGFGLACLPLMAAQAMEVTNAYMPATPATFPAAAVFMTIHNDSDTDDRMIDFKTGRAERAELHTMSMEGDIMKMRRVDGYEIPAGETHVLKPMADHVMVFGMSSDFVAGETVDAVALFEKAGEVPVTITVKDKADINAHAGH